jgi:glycerol-1-phosphate dehydrogenase [NAD(P)+]
LFDIKEINVNEMAGLSFECTCGRRHSVGIKNIVTGSGVSNRIPELLADFKKGEILLLADTNTYRVCGEKVLRLLKNGGYQVREFIFNTPEERHLIPDEKAIGRVFIEHDSDLSLILSVGSGVLNDLGKYLSYKTGTPYIIVATAPSMDGYASVVSPAVLEGRKVTLKGTYPAAVIGDTEILRNAPKEMINAGFGDIIGKITALADWNLSRVINNELYCETCADMVKNSLERCIENIDGIVRRDEKSIQYLMEALLLAGIAIGFHGDSRPASGSEHSFAHYWDMDAIARGEEHPLHGNSVAVGTVITSYVYEYMRSYLPKSIEIPDPRKIMGYLKRIGAASTPKELGISRELFTRSMLEAYKLKTRYIIFNFVQAKGLLDDIAKQLTEIFYP